MPSNPLSSLASIPYFQDEVSALSVKMGYTSLTEIVDSSRCRLEHIPLVIALCRKITMEGIGVEFRREAQEMAYEWGIFCGAAPDGPRCCTPIGQMARDGIKAGKHVALDPTAYLDDSHYRLRNPGTPKYRRLNVGAANGGYTGCQDAWAASPEGSIWHYCQATSLLLGELILQRRTAAAVAAGEAAAEAAAEAAYRAQKEATEKELLEFPKRLAKKLEEEAGANIDVFCRPHLVKDGRGVREINAPRVLFTDAFSKKVQNEIRVFVAAKGRGATSSSQLYHETKALIFHKHARLVERLEAKRDALLVEEEARRRIKNEQEVAVKASFEDRVAAKMREIRDSDGSWPSLTVEDDDQIRWIRR
jgi:hypothetical protein